MTKTLRSAYQKYRKTKPQKNKLLKFLRKFTPEIVYRTMKLEGEPVSRKDIYSWLQ